MVMLSLVCILPFGNADIELTSELY